MQVTSDIRNLVSNLSENMTPATAGSINGSSSHSQSSGGASTMDDPNDHLPPPHNELINHPLLQQGENHPPPHVAQIAIDVSHERTSANGIGQITAAPLSNDEKHRSRGDSSQIANFAKPTFSRSTPTSPHSLSRQTRTTHCNGSAIKRVSPFDYIFYLDYLNVYPRNSFKVTCWFYLSWKKALKLETT